MADGDQEQLSRPVVEDAKAKIASLIKIAERMQQRIGDLEQRGCRTQHEQRELSAIKDSIRVMEWHRASVDDQCEAERLLVELVNAERGMLAASTSEERARARAEIDEIMGHATTWVDDRD